MLSKRFFLDLTRQSELGESVGGFADESWSVLDGDFVRVYSAEIHQVFNQWLTCFLGDVDPDLVSLTGSLLLEPLHVQWVL